VEERRERHAGKHDEAHEVCNQQDRPSIPAVRVNANDQSEQQEGHELERPNDPQLKR
jgi:hypothetical protein